MSISRDEKKENGDQSSNPSDCSSSLLSSSSWYSSSSSASSSSDESDGSIFPLSSSRRSEKNQLHEAVQYGEDSFFRLSSLMRHRRVKAEEGRRWRINRDDEQKYKDQSSHSLSDESYSSKNKKGRGGGNGRSKIRSSFHWSSSLLTISLLVWCGVQIATTEYFQNQYMNIFNTERDQVQGRFYHGINNDHPHHSSRDGNTNQRHHPFPHRPPPTKGKNSASKKEMLQPGCELDRAWQTPESNTMLLSCQLLHELDLSEVLSSVSSSWASIRRRRSLSSSAHLGSGLWRDVWKIRDNIIRNKNFTKNTINFVVLKTMKPEHEVIHRNFERHRREAATMSRLTNSPHVADLFAYCGNSILTEFATQDLSHALKARARQNANDSHSKRRRKTKGANRVRRAKEQKEMHRHFSFINNINNTIGDFENHGHSESRDMRSDTSRNFSISLSMSSSLSTTLPITTRIDWALQASKAIADMHRSDVIHADITTKQFLIISKTGGARRGGNDTSNDNVQVKINDFNRCRFVPRMQKSQGNEALTELSNSADTKSTWTNKTRRCTIRIPSAPGSYRSPEEYSDKALTPQMDVYSLGHVLYEIWTSGQSPWHDVGGKRIKNMVMDGALPVELKRLEDWDVQSKRQQASSLNNSTNEDFLYAEKERAFGQVIRYCYLVDPERRITADILVQKLTKLIDSVRS